MENLFEMKIAAEFLNDSYIESKKNRHYNEESFKKLEERKNKFMLKYNKEINNYIDRIINV